MKIKDKKFLVVGLGVSGAATARFLKRRGAAVTVTDMASQERLASHVPSMRELGIRLELGEHRPESFESADAIVISPGVPHTIPPVKAAQEKGVPVMGEIELASCFVDVPIVAVTGTNGKTTTTTLLGKMLESSGLNVFVGGNIGYPLIGYVDSQCSESPLEGGVSVTNKTQAGGREHPPHPPQGGICGNGNAQGGICADGKKADVIVLEISSFQLDTIRTFRPKVAVLLNITEDHLDRYPDFAAYAASKARIFENQGEEDFAVINRGDPLVASLTRGLKTRVLDAGDWVLDDEGKFRISDFGFRISDRLLGRHNMENISAACLAATAAGGTAEGIRKAIKEFKGLPHRTGHVATMNGVRYFDDSKATNTDAVIKALECFDESVILIMGGRGKGNGFHVLEEAVRGRVKALIAMGETKSEIKSSLEDAAPVTMAADMADAVRQAHGIAAPGDTVLLSPACSSFDMYGSYAERGNDFRGQVERLRK